MGTIRASSRTRHRRRTKGIRATLAKSQERVQSGDGEGASYGRSMAGNNELSTAPAQPTLPTHQNPESHRVDVGDAGRIDDDARKPLIHGDLKRLAQTRRSRDIQLALNADDGEVLSALKFETPAWDSHSAPTRLVVIAAPSSPLFVRRLSRAAAHRTRVPTRRNRSAFLIPEQSDRHDLGDSWEHSAGESWQPELTDTSSARNAWISTR